MSQPTPPPPAIRELECPDCNTLHDHAIALMFCCNRDEERRRGVYRGID